MGSGGGRGRGRGGGGGGGVEGTGVGEGEGGGDGRGGCPGTLRTPAYSDPLFLAPSLPTRMATDTRAGPSFNNEISFCFVIQGCALGRWLTASCRRLLVHFWGLRVELRLLFTIDNLPMDVPPPL